MGYYVVDDSFNKQYDEIYKKVFPVSEGSKIKNSNGSVAEQKTLVKLIEVILEPKDADGTPIPYVDGDIVQFAGREQVRSSDGTTQDSTIRFDDRIADPLDDGTIFDAEQNILGWGIDPLSFTTPEELTTLIDTINNKYGDEVIEVTLRHVEPDTQPAGFEAEIGVSSWGMTGAIAEAGGGRQFVVITSVPDPIATPSIYIGDVVASPLDSTVVTADVDIVAYGVTGNPLKVGNSFFSDYNSTDDKYYLDVLLTSASPEVVP